MKFKTFLLATLVACAAFASAAADDDTKFKIAGGGGINNHSVYSQEIADLTEPCSTDTAQIEEVVTKGGPQNLELLKANKVKAAIIPSDVLFAAKLENASTVAPIKTIARLQPEAAHLIVRADAKIEGGVKIWGTNKVIGGTDVVFNKPEDLNGRVVGAVGGSAVTARVLSGQLKYGWQVDDSSKGNAELIDKLGKHVYDAIVISAGVPSDAVNAIPPGFKLLPIVGDGRVSGLYQPITVNYANLNGGHAVQTLASPALLVSRSWRDPDVIKQMSDLRACVYKMIPKLQDKTGTHPVWQTIAGDEAADAAPADNGKWPWYELPGSQKVAAAPAGKKPAKK